LRRVILAIVATAAGLVLLLSFKTHSPSTLTSAPLTPVTGPTGGGGGSGAAAGSSPAPTASLSSSAPPKHKASPSSAATTSTSAPPPAPAPAVAKTVTGDAVQTVYGPVQVQVTVKSGRITAVNAVVYPQDTPRDQQINSYAIPALNQEALAANSAKIDAVSGASYTSGGYISSLQSALDKAGM
jgi:uncharacterized protein with FMN-binding domain